MGVVVELATAIAGALCHPAQSIAWKFRNRSTSGTYKSRATTGSCFNPSRAPVTTVFPSVGP